MMSGDAGIRSVNQGYQVHGVVCAERVATLETAVLAQVLPRTRGELAVANGKVFARAAKIAQA